MFLTFFKKIMFNDVLAMEYLMKNKKYSNADHILVPWMKITLMLFGLFISFLDTLYDIVTSTHDSDKIHRVQRNDYFQNTFKYPTSNIIDMQCLQKSSSLSIRFLQCIKFWLFSFGRVLAHLWFIITL